MRSRTNWLPSSQDEEPAQRQCPRMDAIFTRRPPGLDSQEFCRAHVETTQALRRSNMHYTWLRNTKSKWNEDEVRDDVEYIYIFIWRGLYTKSAHVQRTKWEKELCGLSLYGAVYNVDARLNTNLNKTRQMHTLEPRYLRTFSTSHLTWRCWSNGWCVARSVSIAAQLLAFLYKPNAWINPSVAWRAESECLFVCM